MNPTQMKLTPAAKRDLELIRQGLLPDLRYGPYSQLLEAGYIGGPQESYWPNPEALATTTRPVYGRDAAADL